MTSCITWISSFTSFFNHYYYSNVFEYTLFIYGAEILPGFHSKYNTFKKIIIFLFVLAEQLTRYASSPRVVYSCLSLLSLYTGADGLKLTA